MKWFFNKSKKKEPEYSEMAEKLKEHLTDATKVKADRLNMAIEEQNKMNRHKKGLMYTFFQLCEEKKLSIHSTYFILKEMIILLEIEQPNLTLIEARMDDVLGRKNSLKFIIGEEIKRAKGGKKNEK